MRKIQAKSCYFTRQEQPFGPEPTEFHAKHYGWTFISSLEAGGRTNFAQRPVNKVGEWSGGGGQEKGAREGEGLEGTLSRPLPSLPSLALLDYVSSLTLFSPPPLVGDNQNFKKL